ncbi:MAG TPA: YwiC-like family protein [Symbiobacteriaceae bacterium]
MAAKVHKWYPPLPREHGAWAMLLTPAVVAVAAHGPDPRGLLALLGWICAYALRGPVELLRGTGPTGRAGLARGTRSEAVGWLIVMSLIAVPLVGVTIWQRPVTAVPLAVALLMLGAVQWLANRGQARSVLAGLLSIAGLMAGAPLYYLAAQGSLGVEGWCVTLACFAFFGGSVFRVKSVARERHSASFRRLSVALHVGAVLAALAAVLWLGAPPLLPVALIPPAYWAVRCARTQGPPNLGKVGMAEIWLTLAFAGLLVAAMLI